MAAKENLIYIGTSYQTNQIDDKRSIYPVMDVTEAELLGIPDSNLT